jgi:hypothetical protein
LSQLIVWGVDCHWGGSLRGLSGLYPKTKYKLVRQLNVCFLKYVWVLNKQITKTKFKFKLLFFILFQIASYFKNLKLKIIINTLNVSIPLLVVYVIYSKYLV